MPSDRVAIVGCGSQKLDLSGDKGPVTIARLYTSNYFELKREYAKECCDDYYILSAKHGFVPPGFYVEERYDLTISDLEGDEREVWLAEVRGELERFGELQPETTLVLLAGRDYVDPLRSTLAELPNDVEYPFDDTSGIGEQMGWLKEEIERANADTSGESDDGSPTLEDFS